MYKILSNKLQTLFRQVLLNCYWKKNIISVQLFNWAMNETSVSRLLPIIADTHATAKNLYDKNINMSSHVQQQNSDYWMWVCIAETEISFRQYQDKKHNQRPFISFLSDTQLKNLYNPLLIGSKAYQTKSFQYYLNFLYTFFLSVKNRVSFKKNLFRIFSRWTNTQQIKKYVTVEW